MTKTDLVDEFNLFVLTVEGIAGWLNNDTGNKVYDRLSRLEREPLKKVQLNQLLAFAHEGPITDGFYRYYWFTIPKHTYDVTKLPNYNVSWLDAPV